MQLNTKWSIRAYSAELWCSRTILFGGPEILLAVDFFPMFTGQVRCSAPTKPSRLWIIIYLLTSRLKIAIKHVLRVEQLNTCSVEYSAKLETITDTITVQSKLFVKFDNWAIPLWLALHFCQVVTLNLIYYLQYYFSATHLVCVARY